MFCLSNERLVALVDGSGLLALVGAIVLCILAAVAYTVHTRHSFRRKHERFQRLRANPLVPRHVARADLVECFFDAPAVHG